MGVNLPNTRELISTQRFIVSVAEMYGVDLMFTALPSGVLGAFTVRGKVILLDILQPSDSTELLSVFFHELGHYLHHKDNPGHPYYYHGKRRRLGFEEFLDVAVDAERETDAYGKEAFRTFFPYHKYIAAYGKRSDRERLRECFEGEYGN